MFSNILLAATDGGLMDTANAVAETFGFSKWAFVAQVLSFSLVCGALYKFAYGPVLKILDERRQKIEVAYKEAAAIKVQVADAERRASEIVVQASSGAHKMIEEAKAAAVAFQEKQMLQARQDAEALVAKAREEARRDYDRMLSELKAEVARLVVDTTAKVSGKVLTAEDQRRLTEEANREIAA
jgi:F-type H+-transporting ATPase subunit b